MRAPENGCVLADCHCIVAGDSQRKPGEREIGEKTTIKWEIDLEPLQHPYFFVQF